MNTRRHLLITAFLCIVFSLQLFAQSTAFTYQGQLQDNGLPANGLYDLRFTLYDTETLGASLGECTNNATVVSKGVFTVTLDFGDQFPGTDRWLEIGVRPSGDGVFSPLTPRQPVTATPYAIRALTAATVPTGTITSAMLADGSVTSSKIAEGAVSRLGTPDGSDTSVVQVSNDGLVGLGNVEPQAGLDVTAGRVVRTPELIFEVANDTGSFTNLLGNESLAASGNLLAVASSGSSSVTLVDVSNPQAPVVRSQLRDGVNGFDRLAGVRRIALSGSLLVISSRPESAVTLVNVSDPDNPLKLAELVDGVGDWNYLGGAMGVAVSGNLLAITAEYDDAVTLANISNPAAPEKLAEIVNGQPGFTNLDGPVSALISGSELYIGAWENAAVTIADISNPNSPAPLAALVNGVGGYGGLAGADGLALSDDLLVIVGNVSDRVTLVDVTQPANPVKVAEFQNGRSLGGEGAETPRFFQKQLVVTDRAESTVTVYDLTDPESPRLALQFANGTDNITLLSGAYSLSVAGTNLFVGGGQSLVIMGVGTSDATASLITLGRVGIGTTDPQSELHVVGDATIMGRLSADFMMGGLNSRIESDSDYSAIGGGIDNSIQSLSHEATIGGGGRNSVGVNSWYSTIGGGYDNVVQDDASLGTIGGGQGNVIGKESWRSSIGAGFLNVIEDESQGSRIGGGYSHTIGTNSDYATIAGGENNHINPGSGWTSIVGGRDNTIGTNSSYAMIGGGRDNSANGDYSFAAGRQAKALHDGAFVWADSAGADFVSTDSNQFLIRATGGVGINTNDPAGAALQVNGAVVASSYAGSGAGITALDAGELTSGTVADERIVSTITRDSEVMPLVLDNDGPGSGLNADLLDGLDSTAFVRTIGPASISGKSSASATLTVTQSGSQNGILATTASTDSGEAAVVGRAGTAAANLNSVAGVFGTSASGRGVVGSSTSNQGILGFSSSGTGVSGQSSSGNGVEGLAASASGTVYGVKGESLSGDGGAGVRGDSDYVGVWGESSGRWGLYGRSTGTSSSYGVYGSVSAGTGNYAGYFSGNVHVTGTLSKGAGSFKIDHPLDPENKYLSHSFVESPDMMNVYNGNVTLDKSGSARVKLPAYFEALNRDFRYQLTPVGGPGPNLHIAQTIHNNSFRIAGGSPGLQVSWQVTGIRHDAFANANRIPVEEDKPAEEKGTYLHPEALGHPKAMGLEHIRHPGFSGRLPAKR